MNIHAEKNDYGWLRSRGGYTGPNMSNTGFWMTPPMSYLLRMLPFMITFMTAYMLMIQACR